jgi:Putative addiction module component
MGVAVYFRAARGLAGVRLYVEEWRVNGPRLPIPQRQEEELDRRLKTFEENGSQGMEWDEFCRSSAKSRVPDRRGAGTFLEEAQKYPFSTRPSPRATIEVAHHLCTALIMVRRTKRAFECCVPSPCNP